MFLTRQMLEFQTLHPQLAVLLTFNDRYIDLVEEGIDVAVRFGRLGDATLVARRLALSPIVVVAAPAYLERAGHPKHPRDLTRHRCLHYTYLSTGEEWVFPTGEGDLRVRVNSTFRSNNGYALRDAMLAGQGITIMPLVFVQGDLASGKAQTILPDYAPPPIPVNAVYPSGRIVPAKVRAFVDFMQERMPRIPGMLAARLDG
jgi:DNA-binding transcriptional LysR family regulator